MDSPQCLLAGCRRKVRPDYIYAPYCHDHRSYSSTYAESTAAGSKLLWDGMAAVPDSSVSTVRSTATAAYREGTSAAEDVVSSIIDCMTEIEEGVDLSVPNLAMDRLATRAMSLRDALIRKGIDPERVGIMRVKGLHRMVGGRETYNPDTVHQILHLDEGTENEVVIDPSIAAFAPVRRRKTSVDVQLPSGITPYGDSPWIGDPQDYLNGTHIWWEHSEPLPEWEMPMDGSIGRSATARSDRSRTAANIAELNF